MGACIGTQIDLSEANETGLLPSSVTYGEAVRDFGFPIDAHSNNEGPPLSLGDASRLIGSPHAHQIHPSRGLCSGSLCSASIHRTLDELRFSKI